MKRWGVFSLALIVLIASPVLIKDVESIERPEGVNWTHTNYDERGTNFNPQTQINADNAFRLQDDWFYAFRVQPANYGYELPLGSSARPLVINGIVYLPTNFLRIDAINMLDARPIWTYSYPANITQIPSLIPNVRLFDPGRVRGISYYNGTLYYPTPDCSILLLDALSGVPKFLGDLTGGRMCKNVPGNTGFTTGQMLYGPVFYTKGQVLITGVGVSGRADSGRGFIAGFDLRTGKLLWRFFLMPPASGDPKWSLKWKGKGNVEPVEGDWGRAIGVGVGAGAGQWAVDEETGIVYVTSSPPSPKWNGTYRPGPNLFSSAILALDAVSGELVWYYQTTPHDIGGLGCDWNVILGKTRIEGIERKVIYKACGNGLLHALDATTGEPIWIFKPPSVKYLNTPNSLYPISGNADIRLPFANAPLHDPYWQCPGITGAVSSDISLAYNKVYIPTSNFCDYIQVAPAEPILLDSFGAVFPKPNYDMPRNTTIYAVDASSGKILWNLTIDSEAYAGGLVASGGVLYLAGIDKNFYAIDTESGKLLFKRIIGSATAVGPVIAANAFGRQQLLISTGGYPERWGRPVSGFVTTLTLRQSLNESPKNPEKSSTGETPISLVLFILVVIASVLIMARRIRRRTKVQHYQKSIVFYATA